MKKSSKVFSIGVGSLFFMALMTAMPVKLLNASQKIVGNDKLVTKTLSVNAFDTVNASGTFDVTIKSGKASSVSMTADENIMPYIRMEVADKTLTMNMKSGFTIFSSGPQKAVVTTPSVKRIAIMGNSKMTAKEVKEENLHLALSGNDEVNLAGEVKNLTIEVQGNTTVNAKNLKADNVVITGAGNLDLTVHAVKKLDVNAFGKSDIKYYGNPEVNRTAFGLISIQKIDR